MGSSKGDSHCFASSFWSNTVTRSDSECTKLNRRQSISWRNLWNRLRRNWPRRRHYSCQNVAARQDGRGSYVPSGRRIWNWDQSYSAKHGNGGFALWRDATAGPFTNEEIHSAELLAPHLVRAARLMTRLSEVRTREHLACEALEQFAVPVFVVNSTGRVRFVNAAGRAMIAARDGLCIVNGQLEALSINETAALSQLIHGAALARRQGYSTSGGSLSVTRKGNSPAFNLVVAPLSPSRSGTDWPIEDAALVVASRQKPASARAAIMLQKQFNLTPAEIRLIQLVGEGIDPMQMAERLSVSITTIRTHLQRLFDKTGTRRQAELVRLVLTHPALIISGGEEESVGSNNKR